MQFQLQSRFLAFIATVSLVILSAVSAHGMAPDRDEVARQATLLIMGASAEDLCEDGTMGHVHDCPLCHKLPTAPEATPPATPITLALWDGFPKARDLLSGPTALTRDGAPRAPPRLV